MKKLHLVNLAATDNIISPEQFEEINLASPAVEIFTDFNYGNNGITIDVKNTCSNEYCRC